MRGGQPDALAGPADDQAVEEPLHLEVPWLAKCDRGCKWMTALVSRAPSLTISSLIQVTGYTVARLADVDVWKTILPWAECTQDQEIQLWKTTDLHPLPSIYQTKP